METGAAWQGGSRGASTASWNRTRLAGEAQTGKCREMSRVFLGVGGGGTGARVAQSSPPHHGVPRSRDGESRGE